MWTADVPPMAPSSKQPEPVSGADQASAVENAPIPFKPRVQLRCKTGKVYQVELDDLKKAVVLRSLLDDLGIGSKPNVKVDPDIIPLPNLSELCMKKMLIWCREHRDTPDSEPGADIKAELTEWEKKFLQMDHETLFDLILAAHYLQIKGLLDITTTYVARFITDMGTAEGIKKHFNLKEELSEKDLNQIKDEAKHWFEYDGPTNYRSRTPATTLTTIRADPPGQLNP